MMNLFKDVLLITVDHFYTSTDSLDNIYSEMECMILSEKTLHVLVNLSSSMVYLFYDKFAFQMICLTRLVFWHSRLI